MKECNFRITLIFVCLYGLLTLAWVGIGYAQEIPGSDTLIGKIEKMEKRLGKVENKVSIQKEYERELADFKENAEGQIKQARNEVHRIWRVFQIGGITIAIVAGLAAILTFIGTRGYLGLHERLTETMNLCNIMEKSIDEKEKELHEKFGEIIGKKKQEYTSLDIANFLDYEHRLYFAQVYLPVTRDVMKFKGSLYILGTYWLEQENFGRALLRFREIERIQDELDSKKNYLFRILKSISRKAIVEERILGKDTARFFNKYGYTYNALAEESKNAEEIDALLAQAEEYYKRAISIDPNYASPYYNLARLYSYNKKEYELALEWNRKVFGKTPELSIETHRNMGCCLIKMEKPIEEIIKRLVNIPTGNPYWQEVANDEFIGPKIKATPELRDFIKRKYPDIKLPS